MPNLLSVLLARLRGRNARPFTAREIEAAFRTIDALDDPSLRFADPANDAGPVFYIAEAFAWDDRTARRMRGLWRNAHDGTASLEDRCRLGEALQSVAPGQRSTVSA